MTHKQSFRGLFLSIMALITVVQESAFAQIREGATGHQLISIYPAAVQPGAETDLVVTTNNQGEIQGIVSGLPGLELVSVTRVEVAPPTPPRGTPPPSRTAPRPTAMTTPANQTQWTVRVRVPRDAQTGLNDLRMTGSLGISNPRLFLVRSGSLNDKGRPAELVEKEPNSDVSEAQSLGRGQAMTGAIQTPTDVDYFRIEGTKGQKLTLVLRTSSIDSRLAPMLELFGTGGRRVASGRALFENDTILVYTPEKDSPLFVRLTSQAYVMGGPDAFYHLTHATEPVVQGVFPGAIEAGKTEKVTVFGWNLPDAKPAFDMEQGLEKAEVELKAPESATGLVPRTIRLPRMAFLEAFEESIAGPNGISLPFLVAIAHDRSVHDNGTNNDWADAQRISAPCEIAGWFEKKGDRDWYRFAAKRGDRIALEMTGDKLGSDLDLQLAVFRFPTPGKKPDAPLLDLDDNAEILHPQIFFSRTEDPATTVFTATEDRDYLIRVTHRESDLMAGPKCVYRLRVGPQRPGFSVVAIPANQAQPDGLNFRPGASNALMVFASRRGGFSGPIRIEPSSLPPGITSEGVTLVPGQRQGLILLGASPRAGESVGMLRLRATATLGEILSQQEVPTASLLWPHPNPNNNQIMPLLVRLDQGTWVANRDLPSLGATVGAIAEDAHIIGPGGTIDLNLKINRTERFPDAAEITIVGIPNQNSFTLKGVLANRPLAVPAEENSVPVTIEARNNIPPGVYNLSLRVHTIEKDEKIRRSVIDFTESIPVTYVPNRIFDVTAATVGRWRPGTEATLALTVNRLSQYDGPVRVEVSFAEEGKGTVEPVEIPADQTRITIPVKLSKDLLPNRPVRLTIRSTAKIGSVEKTAESRTTAQIVK